MAYKNALLKTVLAVQGRSNPVRATVCIQSAGGSTCIGIYVKCELHFALSIPIVFRSVSLSECVNMNN